MAHVIEGTWEEIKQHEAELIGRHLRVTIKPERPVTRVQGPKTKKLAASSKVGYVSAMGSLAGVLSVEDFMRRKQEEIDLEDRLRQ